MNKEYSKARRLFLVLTALWSAFFATGNWLFFYRRFMTNEQIGIFDAICFAFSLLVEIPSGAIADRWGRRRTMLVAVILMGIGYSGIGLATGAGYIYVGYLIYALGGSLFSGADDAFMYDYLKSKNLESNWQKLQREKNITRRIGNVVATVIGGPLYAISNRLPSVVRGVFFLLMAVPLGRMGFMNTQIRTKKDSPSYLRTLRDGIKTLARRSTLPLVLLIVFIGGIGNTFFIGGVLRPFMLERTGLSVTYHPYVIALAGLASVFLLFRQPHIKTRRLFISSVLISLVMILGFVLNITLWNSALMIFGVVLIHIANYLLQPLISELVNNEASSEHRATAISTANLLDQLAYVVAAPFIGLLVTNQKLGIFTSGLVVVMFIALSIAFLLHRKIEDQNNTSSRRYS